MVRASLYIPPSLLLPSTRTKGGEETIAPRTTNFPLFRPISAFCPGSWSAIWPAVWACRHPSPVTHHPIWGRSLHLSQSMMDRDGHGLHNALTSLLRRCRHDL